MYPTMKSELPAHQRQRGTAVPNKTEPKLGEWYWVDTEDWEEPTSWINGQAVDGKGKKTTKRLLCVTHLASNHVVFSKCDHDGYDCGWRVRYKDLEAITTLEPQWQAILQCEINAKQIELKAAVEALCDTVRNVGLLPDPKAPPTLLPAITRRDPEVHKRELIALKEKQFPEAEKRVEHITKQITALHKCLYLPFKSEAERMAKAVSKVDDRLFVLELYAGLFQSCKQIAQGQAPEANTPVAVRQMLRYMDEECLIDYDKGGIDHWGIDEFDNWVAKPENYQRLAPEPRCIVALRVRRYDKQYDTHGLNFAGLLGVLRDHQLNMQTYLLIRNGSQIFRLATEIDFSPRLLPMRDAFVKPFTGDGWHGKEGKTITPDDLDYDKHVEARMAEIFKYNRVMFLVQGLLDRSKVFSPHPPINLADPAHVEQWFKAVFDEETGLPSSEPVKWEAYRDAKNMAIRIGSAVWSNYYPESDYSYSRFDRGEKIRENRRRPSICNVTSIKRDRSAVRVSWPWGKRWGYEHRDSFGNYYGKYGEWEVNKMCHTWVPMDEVFNVSAYVPGEYKRFLCDAYMKGAYLQWAPQLLAAENWHNKRKTK